MLSLATFNLCNLGADAPPERLQRLAAIVGHDLACPDILAVQEVKAPAEAAATTVPATAVYERLIAAIQADGGPTYDFREIPPRRNQEGGHPEFNIRNGLLFNPDRVCFVDRGAAGPDDGAGIRRGNGYPSLTLSPGRIEPRHPAFSGDSQRHWAASRKALAAEFSHDGHPLFVIVCHLKSMRADTRRTEDYTKKQRHAQAQLIHTFVAGLLACHAGTRVVVAGDMNDVRGSRTLKILKGTLLCNLVDEVLKPTCYTRRHGGSPQALDHVLISPALVAGARICIPHVSTDRPEPERVSDHDPVLVSLNV